MMACSSSQGKLLYLYTFRTRREVRCVEEGLCFCGPVISPFTLFSTHLLLPYPYLVILSTSPYSFPYIQLNMAWLQSLRLDDAKHDEKERVRVHVDCDRGEITNQYHRDRKALSNGQENVVRVRGTSLAISPGHKRCLPTYGKPAMKKRLHPLDLLAVGLSLVYLILAVVAVENKTISWRLGLINYQLILSGFLLSVMNLCLGSVTPTLFLLIEARFGSSTLQKYDGILRNQLFSSGLGLIWRLVLGLMMALPLALSAAYKGFIGGESVMKVNATSYVGNASYYGIFAPLDGQMLQ